MALLLLGVVVACGLLSIASVHISIALSHRYKVYDRPDSPRKVQTTPIPRLGGLAVAASYSLASLAILVVAFQGQYLSLGLGVLIPALFGAAVGFADDRSNINPWLRLVLQAGIGLSLWFGGTQVSVSDSTLINVGIVVLWVMIVINGINLIDNADGLAGLTVLVTGTAAGLIALLFGQTLVSILAFSLAGVSIGFLWHNWFPAKVYLGDTGSYFFGVLVAALTIRLNPEFLPPLIGVVIALLLVLLPIVDTTYVVLKRLRLGIHPFTAGRDHLSHYLQNRGLSIPKSVLGLQVFAAVGATLAILIAFIGVQST